MSKLILRSLTTASLLLVLLSVPSIASADSVLWTLTGVTFAGIDPTSGSPNGTTGGTITGSFAYDFATNTYSAIDLVSTSGSGFGGATYTSLTGGTFSGSQSSTGFIAGDGASSGLTGTAALQLLFELPLFNSGGTVTDPLMTGIDSGGGEGTCDDDTCSSATEDRFITGGPATSTVAVVTPEPTALSLLGVALAALLAGAAIRKASQA